MKSILFKPFLIEQTRKGNKTQTRRVPSCRVIEKLKYACEVGELSPDFFNCEKAEDQNYLKTFAKYQIGETIYVKERFEIYSTYMENMLHFQVEVKYSDGKTNNFVVDQETFKKYNEKRGKKYSPRFMPEIFARDFIKITNVRVEKLQDISEEDAIAEGIEKTRGGYVAYLDTQGFLFIGENAPRFSFESLWDSIHGKDKSKNWDANPWVFVYEFEKVEKENE